MEDSENDNSYSSWPGYTKHLYTLVLAERSKYTLYHSVTLENICFIKTHYWNHLLQYVVKFFQSVVFLPDRDLYNKDRLGLITELLACTQSDKNQV